MKSRRKKEHTKMKNVLILFGGQSNEYGVSLKSAASVIENIDCNEYNAMMIGITEAGKWLSYYGPAEYIRNNTWFMHKKCKEAILSPCRSHKGFIEIDKGRMKLVTVDVVFPVLHGKYGEDGTLQGLIELSGIPVVGCKTLSSAICMDKAIAHTLVRQAGIKVTQSIIIFKNEQQVLRKIEEKHMKLPMYVKPAKSGSSIGITKVSDLGELKEAIEVALSYDDKVVIEESIDGFEVGCAVLGKHEFLTGEIDEIELTREFFNFNEKYTLENSKIHTPARISETQKNQIKKMALQIYQVLSCEGLARVDMFIDKQGEIFFNEVNTMPGFTEKSRYPKMMETIGLNYTQLISRLIEEAFENESRVKEV
ncbi:MAG: D-alanine--D-serine ligase VanG [Cellulosilyticaceae bacterium]